MYFLLIFAIMLGCLSSLYKLSWKKYPNRGRYLRGDQFLVGLVPRLSKFKATRIFLDVQRARVVNTCFLNN